MRVFVALYCAVLAVPAPAAQPPPGLIDRARAIAADYTRTLPDFVCTQVVRRYVAGARGWVLRDTLLLKLDFVGARETYTLAAIDGQPVTKDYKEVGGAVTTGEFGSLLKRILEPASQAVFSGARTDKLRGQKVTVYRYQVPAAGAHHKLVYRLSDGAPMTVQVPDHGVLYLDSQSGNVLRIESEADHIPSKFPIRFSRASLDYDYAVISGRRYLLPLRARVELHTARSRTRNDVEFTDYRKFSTDTSITFTESTPLKDK